MSKHSAFVPPTTDEAYPELPSRRQVHRTRQPSRTKQAIPAIPVQSIHPTSGAVSQVGAVASAHKSARSSAKRVISSVVSQRVAMVAAVSGIVLAVAVPNTAAITAEGPQAEREQVSAQGLGGQVFSEVRADPGATLDMQKAPEIKSLDPDEKLHKIVSVSAAAVTPEEAKGSLGSPLPTALQINSPFGARANPLGGAGDFHTGIDLQAACGLEVEAAASGKVVFAGWHEFGGGNRVVIDHGNGLQTTYNHMSSIAVKVGDTVTRGERVGNAGTTGNSTGCHLHFEVMVDGKTVDPQKWL